MNLTQYKALFVVVIAILALIAATPALQRVLVYPRSDFFTELSLLGPAHLAENYPYNIVANQNYTVYLKIGNLLGSSAYYRVEVKFRNQTQSAPNSLNFTPSNLPSLYNFNTFVADQESIELPVNFSFNYSFQNLARANSQVNFDSLRVNDVTLNLHGYSSEWNPQTSLFYGNLVLELWIYNGTTDVFQYHERFVDLKFNMTSSGIGDVLG